MCSYFHIAILAVPSLSFEMLKVQYSYLKFEFNFDIRKGNYFGLDMVYSSRSDGSTDRVSLFEGQQP